MADAESSNEKDVDPMNRITFNTPERSNTPEIQSLGGFTAINRHSNSTEPEVASPPPESNTAEFTCTFDDSFECSTGQVLANESRKGVSDHFGRNKAETKNIKRWALICRKHYQRAFYQKETWQLYKCQMIERQLNLLEEDFPGLQYNVSWKSPDQTRITDYNEAIAEGRDAAAEDQAKDPSDEMPIQALRTLDEKYVQHARPRSLEECQQAMADIRAMLDSEEIKKLPGIEFLPIFPDVKAKTSRPASKRVLRTGSPSRPRINSRGAIKKPATPKKTPTKKVENKTSPSASTKKGRKRKDN